LEEVAMFIESKLERFTLGGLDLVGEFSLSTPTQGDESTYFDNPIEEHIRNETIESLTYLDLEVTPLSGIHLYNSSCIL
jgi:hypothetical protein